MATFSGLLDGDTTLYTYNAWASADVRKSVHDPWQRYDSTLVGTTKLPLPYLVPNGFGPDVGHLLRSLKKEVHHNDDGTYSITGGTVSDWLNKEPQRHALPLWGDLRDKWAPWMRSRLRVTPVRPSVEALTDAASSNAASSYRPYFMATPETKAMGTEASPFFVPRWYYEFDFMVPTDEEGEVPLISASITLIPPMLLAGFSGPDRPVYWFAGGMERGFVLAMTPPTQQTKKSAKRVEMEAYIKRIKDAAGGLNPQIAPLELHIVDINSPAGKQIPADVLVKLDEIEREYGGA